METDMCSNDYGGEKHFCGGEFMRKFKKGLRNEQFRVSSISFWDFSSFQALSDFLKSPLRLG